MAQAMLAKARSDDTDIREGEVRPREDRKGEDLLFVCMIVSRATADEKSFAWVIRFQRKESLGQEGEPKALVCEVCDSNFVIVFHMRK